MRGALLLASVTLAFQCSRDDVETTVKRSDYRPPAFQVDRISLNFDLSAEHTTVKADLHILRKASNATTLRLDGAPTLKLDSITLNGDVPKYCIQDRFLEVDVSDVSEDSFNVTTSVHIAPSRNKALFGLYESQGLLITQNEAQGFRRITYHQDRPDVLSIFETTLTADKRKYPVLLSNGNVVRREETLNGDPLKSSVTFLDPIPKPAYLFALVAGDLTNVNATFTVGRPCKKAAELLFPGAEHFCSGPDQKEERDVQLFVWSRPGTQARLTWALESLKTAMLWDEVRFGRFYDLNEFHVVSVRDFNAGAMENKGLNIFNEALIEALPEMTTDASFSRIRGVIAHEYFHNWSGDRVTLRDWFQLTLKEGFTVYRDQTFTSDLTGTGRVEDVVFLQDHQFTEDETALSHPIRPEEYSAIENFYTTTVYEKGAEVIRMYENLLGWPAFRKGTDLYFSDQDGHAATCEDFKDAMEISSGRILSQFYRWYSTPGTPVIAVMDRRYNEANNTYHITIKQSVNPPLLIPIRAALLVGNNVSNNQVLELEEQSQTFVFSDVKPSVNDTTRISTSLSTNSHNIVPSLLRGFSAPVKLIEFLSDEELAQLALYETDEYSRWRAVDSLYRSAVTNETTARETLIPLLAKMLDIHANREKSNDDSLARHRDELASALTPPSLRALSTNVSPFEPEALWRARERIVQQIGNNANLQSLYLKISSEDVTADSYNIDMNQVAQRKLKNVLLRRLCPDAIQSDCNRWLSTQLLESDLYDDRANALSITADWPASEARETLLRDHFDSIRDEPMLIDRWLAAQASSSAADTLEKVKALSQDDLYRNSTTPNRLRALMRTFASNLLHFNNVTGAGYEMVVDEVLRWDKFNPKLAASLTRSFSIGSKLPLSLQSTMLKSLSRITAPAGAASTEGHEVSINVLEIASLIEASLNKSTSARSDGGELRI